MNKKRIKGGARLRDVASAAGVSNATVSAVANGKAAQYGICQATQERVQAAIRQMGYSPSLAALDMVSGRNTFIGLAISANFPAADYRMAAFEPLLAQAGFRVIVAFLPPEPQAASDRIAGLIKFGVAGLVICPVDSMVLPKINCPAVMVGKPGAGLPTVYEDEAEGGRRLAQRLLDKGHRRIAILGETTPQTPAINGFLAACAQVGATVRSFRSVTEFLPMAETMTAVFCVTPAALLELYSRGCAAGLRLGTDLAVVAVDNLGVAVNLVPRPTVLQPGIGRLGQAVAQAIQQAIQGTTPGDVRLDPVIVDGDPICVADVTTRVSVPPAPVETPKPPVLTPVPPSAKPITPVSSTPVPAPQAPVPAPNPTPVSAPQTPSPVTIPSTPKPAIQSSETFQMPKTVVSGVASPASAVVAAVSGGTDTEPVLTAPSTVVAAIPGGTDPEPSIPVLEPAVTPTPVITPDPVLAPVPEITVTPTPEPEPIIPEPVQPAPVFTPPSAVVATASGELAEPIPPPTSLREVMRAGSGTDPEPVLTPPSTVVAAIPGGTDPEPSIPVLEPAVTPAPIITPSPVLVPAPEVTVIPTPEPDPIIPDPVQPAPVFTPPPAVVAAASGELAEPIPVVQEPEPVPPESAPSMPDPTPTPPPSVTPVQEAEIPPQNPESVQAESGQNQPDG